MAFLFDPGKSCNAIILSFSVLLFFLHQVCSRCSETVPPSIVAPLLTPQCIRLLSEEASSEEDNLWQSLGDAWNIPRFLLRPAQSQPFIDINEE